MDNGIKACIKGLEQLCIPSNTSADLVSLMGAVADMTVTDDIACLDFLFDYSDLLLRCIQSDCLSRLICEKE